MTLRLERDGDGAVLGLDNPPQNQFDAATNDPHEAPGAPRVELTDPHRADRARAVLVRAEG